MIKLSNRNLNDLSLNLDFTIENRKLFYNKIYIKYFSHAKQSILNNLYMTNIIKYSLEYNNIKYEIEISFDKSPNEKLNLSYIHIFRGDKGTSLYHIYFYNNFFEWEQLNINNPIDIIPNNDIKQAILDSFIELADVLKKEQEQLEIVLKEESIKRQKIIDEI